MPEISRFFGIVISMHYRDHAPPHIHARYGKHRATIAISDGRLLAGALPPRVVGLVTEWCAMRRKELEQDWDLARRNERLMKVAPLV